MLLNNAIKLWEAGKIKVSNEKIDQQEAIVVRGSKLYNRVLSNDEKKQLLDHVNHTEEKRRKARKVELDEQYDRDMAEQEKTFSKASLDRICINIWDDYDDEKDETYAYVEEDTPDSFNRNCLAFVSEQIDKRTDLSNTAVQYWLSFYDSADQYPNLIGSEYEWGLFRRWEVRFKPLAYARLDHLVDELNQMNLMFEGIPLQFISES